jgi:hypothetical protein
MGPKDNQYSRAKLDTPSMSTHKKVGNDVE